MDPITTALTAPAGSDEGQVFRRGWHRRRTFTVLADYAPFGILVTDPLAPDNPIVSANKRFCEMTGYSEAEIIGRNCRFLRGEGTDPETVEAIRRAIDDGVPLRCEVLNYRRSGEPFWNELNLSPVRDRSGRVINFVGLQHDVTERRAAVEQAAKADQLLEDLADNLPGFLFQRRRGAGPGAEFTLWGRSLQRLAGRDQEFRDLNQFLTAVHPDDRERLASAVAGYSEIGTGSISYRLVTPGGRVAWIRSSHRARHLPNGEVIWDGCAIDVTDERLAQERLDYLRHYDPLTGLMNHSRFEQAVFEAAQRLQPSQSLLLIAVEVDEVAEVRDVMGGAAADEFVQAFARHLMAEVGHSGAIARTGDNSFKVLATPQLGGGEGAGDFLTRRLAAPIHWRSGELRVKPHVGVAVYPAQGSPTDPSGPAFAERLIRHAEIAVMEARRDLPGQPVRFSHDMHERMALRLRLKQSLAQSIDAGEFELYFQPVMSLRTMAIHGAEALLRWRHPDLGLQPPDFFIPLAEETGDILALGAWVIGAALTQLQQWRRQGRDWKVSVNVSPVQLRDPGFADVVETLLARTGAEPGRVIVELTEGAVLRGDTATFENLRKMAEMGVDLAIDDFGAGYSGLRYLNTLPAKCVKVDRSLVRNIGLADQGATVLIGVLDLIRSLGLRCVCEGIETEEQLAFLRTQGVEMGQGFLFSRPLPIEEFEGFAQTWNAGRAAA